MEDQLIAPALFQAMRDAGPLPVAAPATAQEYLDGRRTLLDRRLAEVAAKAAADTLEDVRIKAGELKVTQLKAVTPEAAEAAADRLYGLVHWPGLPAAPGPVRTICAKPTASLASVLFSCIASAALA